MRTGPRDFFMHLFAFGTLYASAVALISLWFQYINEWFPDPLQPMYLYGYEQMRVPMAVLIVVFPVFIFLARWISKQIAIDPERKELRIYKWLVYFTLFISAITVVVDLITLIYNFLGGDLTARFGLKMLIVLVVALAVFGYYLWHLRSDIAATVKKRKILTFATIVVIVGSIILGFFIVGSPASARAVKFDQQRINDLQNLQGEITNYWQQKRVLPANLNLLEDSLRGFIVPIDPRTRENYEYAILDPLKFKLCAVFETKGGWDQYGGYGMVDVYPGMQRTSWYHDAGRTCFERTIDPDFYPKPLQ